MRPVLVASAVLAAFAMSSPLRAADEADAAVVAAPVLPAISVSTVETRALQDRVIVSGLVNPVEEVQVAPLIEGQPIETLLADVGDIVTAGQTLATLSGTTLELQKTQYIAQLASAEATIAQAEAQLLEARASADEAQRGQRTHLGLASPGCRVASRRRSGQRHGHRLDGPRHRGGAIPRSGACTTVARARPACQY